MKKIIGSCLLGVVVASCALAGQASAQGLVKHERRVDQHQQQQGLKRPPQKQRKGQHQQQQGLKRIKTWHE